MSKKECIIRLIVGAVVCLGTLALICALDGCAEDLAREYLPKLDSVQYVIRIHAEPDSVRECDTTFLHSNDDLSDILLP